MHPDKEKAKREGIQYLIEKTFKPSAYADSHPVWQRVEDAFMRFGVDTLADIGTLLVAKKD